MDTDCKFHSSSHHVIPFYAHSDSNGIFRKENLLQHGSVEQLVTEVIIKVGVPANLKGYRYLRTAIMLSLDDVSFLDSVTKRLYPAIAEYNNTTPIRVERAIRHAITAAWSKGDGDSEFLEQMLRCRIDFSRSKPTNSELIALISDSLRLIIMM